MFLNDFNELGENWLGNLEPDGRSGIPFTFNVLFNVASTMWGCFVGVSTINICRSTTLPLRR